MRQYLIMVYNFQHTQQNQQSLSSQPMSHNHISLEQQFFNPANIQQQLNQQTPTNAIIHNNIKILQTLIPSVSQDNLNLQVEMNPLSLRYFQEYKRMYNLSYSLFSEKKKMQDQIKQAIMRLQSMENKINNLDQKYKQNRSVQNTKKCEQQSDDNKNKRARRTAEQIQKKFQCHAHQCERYYGSEGSLQQHIKLKHPQLLKRDDEDEDDEYEKSGEEQVEHSMAT